MKVGVAKETAPGERRVALVPEALGKLKAAGLEVLVERGAGAGASIPDTAYQEAGATIVSTDDLYATPTSILRVAKPSEAEVGRLRAGQAVVGLLAPLIDPKTAKALADRGVTAISLDAIPRTLSRAQTMDALSSQANVGGYKAVLIAANAYGRYFPLLTTAAGTAKPANVLILGIGVAGLQAIGTARRLGAVVKAYDVRPETREQAESLGAQFVKLKTTIDATGAGGYARELTPEERAAQQAELNEVIGGMDIVITTAQVPGRKPPVLVTADAVGQMKSGSVIVDMAASALGGNFELSRGRRDHRDAQRRHDHRPGQPAGLDAGRRVRVLRAQHLDAPARDGQGRGLDLDFEDEVTKSTVISHGGAVCPNRSRSCSSRRRRRLEVPREPRTAQLAGDLHAGDPRRLRGHQQGPGDAAHAADVRRQLDPRHRPGRRDVHRRRGEQPVRLRSSRSSPWCSAR